MGVMTVRQAAWRGGVDAPPRTPVIVDVPEVYCLAIPGAGPQDGTVWARARHDLLSAWQTRIGADHPQACEPPPLEVIWDDTTRHTWTLLLPLPEPPSDLPHDAARHVVPGLPAGCSVIRMHEGWCAQLMFYGASNREMSIARLDRFLVQQGYRPRGCEGRPHPCLHEIYLDAPASTPAPRVIARRPVQPAG